MSAFLLIQRPAVRDAVMAVCTSALVACATLALHLDAVANRFVRKVGVDGVDFRLSSLVSTVLKPAGGAGSTEISNLIIAIVALVLLGAIVYFLFGVFQVLGGRRGGIEAVGQVIFALIVGLAGLEVLA